MIPIRDAISGIKAFFYLIVLGVFIALWRKQFDAAVNEILGIINEEIK